MEKRPEPLLYRWGWVFFAVVAAIVAVRRMAFPDFDILREMPPCWIHSLTGFYCPGCGGTRSVAALLSGRLLESAVDYPMVVYCAAVYVWFMVSHTVELLSRRRLSIGMRYRHGWIYASLVILLVHFVVKNIYYLRTGCAPFL